MSVVDTLLRLLVEDSRNVSARMAAAGYSEAEVRAAWHYARQAGYTEATGLGADRLTEAGRERLARSPEAVECCWGRALLPDAHFLPDPQKENIVRVDVQMPFTDPGRMPAQPRGKRKGQLTHPDSGGGAP